MADGRTLDMSKKPKTLPERVTFARERRGLTARAASLAAGLSHAYVSHLETGRRDPETVSLGSIRALADALDVPFPWLATGEGKGPVAA